MCSQWLVESLALPGLVRNKGPSIPLETWPLEVDCSVPTTWEAEFLLLDSKAGCKPAQVESLFARDSDYSGEPAGGGGPSLGSLTFQETGPAP